MTEHLSPPPTPPGTEAAANHGVVVVFTGVCRCPRAAARPRVPSHRPQQDPKDISKNHQVRKQYVIQLGENELVLKELELLGEEANVYKLIGPVLVKQDLAEAKANVYKRVDYISAELKRVDRTIRDMEDKHNSKKELIFKLQQKMQALQAGEAQV